MCMECWTSIILCLREETLSTSSIKVKLLFNGCVVNGKLRQFHLKLFQMMHRNHGLHQNWTGYMFWIKKNETNWGMVIPTSVPKVSVNFKFRFKLKTHLTLKRSHARGEGVNVALIHFDEYKVLISHLHNRISSLFQFHCALPIVYRWSFECYILLKQFHLTCWWILCTYRWL